MASKGKKSLATDESGLNAKTGAELKEICKEMGITCYGTKAAMITRILAAKALKTGTTGNIVIKKPVKKPTKKEEMEKKEAKYKAMPVAQLRTLAGKKKIKKDVSAMKKADIVTLLVKADMAAPAKKPAATTPTGTPKKRGRPRKVPVEEEIEIPVKKQRGRPRKDAATSAAPKKMTKKEEKEKKEAKYKAMPVAKLRDMVTKKKLTKKDASTIKKPDLVALLVKAEMAPKATTPAKKPTTVKKPAAAATPAKTPKKRGRKPKVQPAATPAKSDTVDVLVDGEPETIARSLYEKLKKIGADVELVEEAEEASEQEVEGTEEEEEVVQRCDDQEDWLECGDDEVCSADSGKCIDFDEMEEGSHILQLKDRTIVGSEESIKKLHKILGGKVIASKKSGSPKKASPKKVSPKKGVINVDEESEGELLGDDEALEGFGRDETEEEEGNIEGVDEEIETELSNLKKDMDKIMGTPAKKSPVKKVDTPVKKASPVKKADETYSSKVELSRNEIWKQFQKCIESL